MSKTRLVFLESVLALLACLTAAAATPGSLRVGAARIDITPASDPADPPTGKYEHERLYVRAIVLDNGSARAVLIGADQGMLSELIWTAASKQIAQEVDCPVANIIMSATHTHSGWGAGAPIPRGGPMAAPDPNLPPPPIVAQILDAVRQEIGRAHV